ncbi:LGFP repeat-containing protein [Nocardia sp. NPDC003482]|uniref:LGFP repeat-containing protein n=1 Tax=Nocardia sp. NPDC004068 TaxID=3364303 RepID=UPI0036AB7B2C
MSQRRRDNRRSAPVRRAVVTGVAAAAAVVSITAGSAAARPIGPFDVGGAIETEYDRAGGFTTFGNPVGPETDAARGGKFQVFEKNNSIYWSVGTDAHYVGGLIRDKWAALGWENGALGFPITDEQKARNGDGRYNLFDGGSIYWSPRTGAHAVWGAIRDIWVSNVAEAGRYGYPTSDEYDYQGGKAQDFQGGRITWHP